MLGCFELKVFSGMLLHLVLTQNYSGEKGKQKELPLKEHMVTEC